MKMAGLHLTKNIGQFQLGLFVCLQISQDGLSAIHPSSCSTIIIFIRRWRLVERIFWVHVQGGTVQCLLGAARSGEGFV